MCFLRAEVGEEDQLVPPVNGWQFKEWGGGTKWSSDGTLECSREVSEPCTEIIVELRGEAERRHPECKGSFRPVDGVFVRGRPVSSFERLMSDESSQLDCERYEIEKGLRAV